MAAIPAAVMATRDGRNVRPAPWPGGGPPQTAEPQCQHVLVLGRGGARQASSNQRCCSGTTCPPATSFPLPKPQHLRRIGRAD